MKNLIAILTLLAVMPRIPAFCQEQKGFVVVYEVTKLSKGKYAVTSSNELPLISAVSQGDVQKAASLLDQGADINGENPNGGDNALCKAVRQNFVAMTELLLEKGANTNSICRDHLESTPLILASRYSDIDIVELLLNYRADINAKDSKHVNALANALKEGRFRVAKLLLSRGAFLSREELLEKASSNIHVLEFTLQEGMLNPNAKDEEGTPLLNLVLKEPEDDTATMIEMLLRFGASWSQEDAEGKNALVVASEEDNGEDVFEAFINHGAKINYQGAGGKTLLISAAETGQLTAVRALLELGADPDAKDDSGRTALDKAQSAGYTDIVRLLKVRKGIWGGPLSSRANELNLHLQETAENILENSLNSGLTAPVNLQTP